MDSLLIEQLWYIMRNLYAILVREWTHNKLLVIWCLKRRAIYYHQAFTLHSEWLGALFHDFRWNAPCLNHAIGILHTTDVIRALSSIRPRAAQKILSLY